MNPATLLTAILLTLGLFGAGVGVGIRWEKGAVALTNQHVAEAVDAANAVAAENADKTAKAIANIKVVNKTINNEVQHETRTETVYRDVACSHTDNGLRLVNQALEPPSAPNAAGGIKLPRANTPR
jgi:hypothetical protein